MCLRTRHAAGALGRSLQRRLLLFAGRDPSNVHSVADHVRWALLPLRSFWHGGSPYLPRPVPSLFQENATG